MFLERELPQYTAEERAIRATNAKRLLNDPFFAEVMEESENQAIQAWIEAADEKARERAWLLIGGLYTIIGTIRSIQADAPPEND